MYVRMRVYDVCMRAWICDRAVGIQRQIWREIAEQAAVNGRLYPAEVWHELAKRKFVGVVELPNGDVVGKSTTELSTAEFSNFCDQVEAWAASELNVVFYDLEGRS